MEQQVLDYLTDNKEAMLAWLEQIVRAESPSTDPIAQETPLRMLGDALEDLGFVVTRLPGNSSAGQLLAEMRPNRSGSARQLMLGHCDTVWPAGTLNAMPIRFEDGRMYGPGVYDMKGGLTQMIFALRALRAAGIDPSVAPTVLVNSDEEVGSSDSVATIERLAREVERVFVLEPSLGPSGKLKTARKGVGRFDVVVTGRAAHAGLDPEKGASAILEMAHVAQRLFALNDLERGISVNVGVISGGTRSNVIAAECRAEVDVRIPTHASADAVVAAIEGLQPMLQGTTIHVAGGINRPPLEHTPANRTLWQIARAAGMRLGIELEEGSAGGGSDGNFTSQHTATLDGLGPIGDGAHAVHEHIVVDSLVERTALLALLLAQPSLQTTVV